MMGLGIWPRSVKPHFCRMPDFAKFNSPAVRLNISGRGWSQPASYTFESIAEGGFTCWSGLLLVRHFFVDVRPEFLYHNRDSVETHLSCPHVGRIAQGAIGSHEKVRVGRRAEVSAFRMVTVGRDCCRGRTPENLRSVEPCLPIVAASHKDPAHGVARAVEKAAVPGLIEPRVLVQGGREEGANHEVLDRAEIGRA